MNIPGPKYS
jgi:hypothetical protein